MRWIALFFSSVAFTGFLPEKILRFEGILGGLVGSLDALVIQIIWVTSGGTSLENLVWWIVLSFVVGIICIGPAERLMVKKWGSKKRHTGKLTESDFNQTNIDELHGQLIAGLPAFLVAFEANWQVWLVLLTGFVLFRIFDSIKPWPINRIEKLSDSPLIIMLDDTMAGIMAGALALVLALLV